MINLLFYMVLLITHQIIHYDVLQSARFEMNNSKHKASEELASHLKISHRAEKYAWKILDLHYR